MFVMDLQLFASKKGVGSSRNGRDSEAKRLGVKKSRWAIRFGREHPGKAERNQTSSR